MDDRGSFNHAISFLKRIAAIKRSQDSALTVVCALVATKADLPPVVSDDEIALLSSNVGCSWYKVRTRTTLARGGNFTCTTSNHPLVQLSARVGAGGDHPTTRSMEVGLRIYCVLWFMSNSSYCSVTNSFSPTQVASVSPPFTYVIQRLQANEGLDLCDMFSSMSVGEEKKNEEECVIL